MAMAMASIAATNDNDEGGTAPRIRTACDLSFHGAAASSRPHSLLWVRAPAPVPRGDADASPDASPAPVALADTVVYASSGVINLATSYDCLSNDVTSVDATLVTRTRDHSASSDPADGRAAANKRSLARGEAAEDAAAARSITALAWVDGGGSGDDEAGADGGGGGGERDGGFFGIVAAFSDGTVTSWRHDDRRRGWTERVLVGHDPRSPAARRRRLEDGLEPSDLQESVADVSAANVDDERGSSWMVATASSKGVFLHLSRVVPTENNEAEESTVSRTIDRHAAASVRFQRRPKVGSGGSSGDGETTNDECYLFAGSASPRHNKVWVYTIPIANDAGSDATSPPLWTIGDPICHGHLLGHQDWVTCFAWLNRFDSDDSQNKGERKESLLASSGHDAKIRLWKFSSWPSSAKDGNIPELEVEGETGDEGSDDEDEAMIDDLEEEEGEARLVINTAPSGGAGGITSAVSLEALLLGHEEAVTSLAWRRPGEGRAPLLLSSSMDRTILLWMEEDPSPEEGGGGAAGGVWVPVSRVGSAGGILGGSVGASLMGFVDAAFSPGADRIAGHGYGGSLHFWTREGSSEGRAGTVGNEAEKAAEEDALATARWVADPCITGHFRPVVDMAWDPDGDYLLTVSSDQTTRLWTEVPVTSEAQCRWVEVGRPQVHGYDMTSIVCIGGTSDGGDANISERGEPRHRFVSGADEKTLRVFDAPASTLRTIYSIKRSRSLSPSEGGSSKNGPASWIGADAVFGHRVERAYLPSLGLSNKATADADQENSKYAGPVSNDDEFADTVVEHAKSVALKLLSERDLGVTTLWPETRKLFGHESELVCLDAYRAPPPTGATGVETTTLVASSCKARNDVASAAIRLWDSKKGKCVGILKGGHRSTVSTMSFSRDGKYLASSGKDRRICIWKRVGKDVSDSGYELSAAVDSAHKRIVWSIHFCPSAPGILASGSRDGLIKLWRVSEEADGSLDMNELIRFDPISKAGKNPITAVAFADELLKGSNEGKIDYGILGIGTESGHVEVWGVPISSSGEGESPNPAPVLLFAIPFNDCHFDAVKRVTWRPRTCPSDGLHNKEEGSMDLTLASCGQDHGVRIYKFLIRH